MVGKDERDTAHPILRITIPPQDSGWRNETTTRGGELFTRCGYRSRVVKGCENGLHRG
jgi:hypothetical protein